jgi:hypothetical protein
MFNAQFSVLYNFPIHFIHFTLHPLTFAAKWENRSPVTRKPAFLNINYIS